MKKFVVVFLIIIIAGIAPVYVLADDASLKTRPYAARNACEMAKNEAHFDQANNFCFWFTCGCILGPLGWLAGVIVVTPVPVSRLAGKSSDYVMNYSNCFIEELRTYQLASAATGCVFSVLFYVGIYFAVDFLNFMKR